ncbi:16S rRNA (guanine(527)-N(7))-methyltransferase RsmG [Candidatus Methylopumilus turicensis]|jgi:16S rRNA (guanine527-N7)-methyltransferase|uniref:Ribosomal RNA small subunit methyltransferase G n=1 Tax=Candidatus Methylopumilus turicensis TaxID=1581680 RepID=A0A0B7IX66_9PROT|nr:16S rRNA (guanine(527)-N(7))-methyltransferase RsmG [Candidatus Methylopumilus turicensis]CEN56811.1 methyltransferase, SAM-dependent methyltransferase, glucose-inhibited cell-division protein [Candidatus Methylopumilus turicensis]
MSQQAILEQGIKDAKLDISAQTQQRLLDYLALMQKWNKVHNLTAVRDADEMVILHLLDSLVVLPFIDAKHLLDVGSGAGLPGIPLAICLPDLQVTVIDSNSKKVSFMRQAKAELGIANLEVLGGRVEEIASTKKFEIIISRAFSDLSLFISLTHHLLDAQGKWLAMKGVYPEVELAELAAKTGVTASKVEVLNVPGLDAQRHLAFLPYQPVSNHSK